MMSLFVDSSWNIGEAVFSIGLVRDSSELVTTGIQSTWENYALSKDCLRAMASIWSLSSVVCPSCVTILKTVLLSNIASNCMVVPRFLQRDLLRQMHNQNQW